MALQHHFDHGVGRQRAVQLIELFAAGGGDRDRHTQVFTALAFTQFDGTGVKRRVELFCNVGDGSDQTLRLDAHHLDGEL